MYPLIEDHIQTVVNINSCNTLKEAFDIAVDEMNKCEWHVATSDVDIMIYTITNRLDDVHQGDSITIVPYNLKGCKIVITEYYSVEDSDFYVYVVKAYNDEGQLKYTSLQ